MKKSLISIVTSSIFPKWVPSFLGIFLVRKFLDKLADMKLMNQSVFRQLSRELSKKVDPGTVTEAHIPPFLQMDLIAAALHSDMPDLAEMLHVDSGQVMKAASVLEHTPHLMMTSLRLGAAAKDQEAALAVVDETGKKIDTVLKSVLALLRVKHHIKEKSREPADGVDFQPASLQNKSRRWAMRYQINMDVRRARGFGEEYTVVDALKALYERPNNTGGTFRVKRSASGTVHMFYLPIKGLRSGGNVILWVKEPGPMASKVGKKPGVYPIKIYVEQLLPSVGFVPALFPTFYRSVNDVKLALTKMIRSYLDNGSWAVQSLQTQSDMDILQEGIRALASSWHARTDRSGSRALILEMDLLTAGGFTSIPKRVQVGWRLVDTNTGHVRYVSDDLLEKIRDDQEAEILKQAHKMWKDQMETWESGGQVGNKPVEREIAMELFDANPYEAEANYEWEVPNPELALNKVRKSFESLSSFHKEVLSRFDVAIRVRDYSPTEVQRENATLAYILFVPNEVGFTGLSPAQEKQISGDKTKRKKLESGARRKRVTKKKVKDGGKKPKAKRGRPRRVG